MNSFAAWGLTILGIAVVTTVAEMILPNGKTKKVIRSTVATLTTLVVITPIPSLIKSLSSETAAPSVGEVEIDRDYLDYIDKAKSAAVVAALKDYLEKQGYPTDFSVEVKLNDAYSVESVTIDFSESGITENGEHINKSEMKGLIAEYFGVGEEAIMTYG